MKPRPFKQGHLRIILLSGLALAVSACASIPAKEQGIPTRAQARWDALLTGDFQTAYGYLSPGYRSSVSLNDYQRKLLIQRVQWTGASYLQSDCLETTCKIRISLDYRITGALPGVRVYEGKRTITEDWIATDGQWWYVPKK